MPIKHPTTNITFHNLHVVLRGLGFNTNGSPMVTNSQIQVDRINYDSIANTCKLEISCQPRIVAIPVGSFAAKDWGMLVSNCLTTQNGFEVHLSESVSVSVFTFPNKLNNLLQEKMEKLKKQRVRYWNIADKYEDLYAEEAA